jgi:hypothetical protein
MRRATTEVRGASDRSSPQIDRLAGAAAGAEHRRTGKQRRPHRGQPQSCHGQGQAATLEHGFGISAAAESSRPWKKEIDEAE